MHPEGYPKGPLFARSLVALVLLAGLLAGCGGEGQSGGGSEGGSGQRQEGGAAKKKGNAPEVKIALGQVNNVEPDRSRIALGLHQEIEGSKRMVFKLKKKVTVQLDGKPAELSDVEEGQQAQIEYVVKNEQNRARVVQLFSTGGGEETG